jgi:hypothetical protein
MKGGVLIMGSFIQDEKFLNDNIFLYEDRIGSQYSIFFDNKNPTFVTYYHINNINSITDTGLLNVENIIGPDSPIRFQKINNFPLYGIENIKPELGEEEEGLTTSFDGEAIVLPNTIKPLPHDFFTINYLDDTFVFMITEISYDTIKSNNFYSVNYTIRAGDAIKLIEKQVLEKYNCIYHNIGTDDKCLIRSDEYEKLHELIKVCNELKDRYLTMFYNKKFNSFLYETGYGTFIYDKYLSHFINENEVFKKPNSYDTLYLNNEDYSNSFITEYEDSIFKCIEDCDKKNIKYTKVLHWRVSYSNSIFTYYNDDSIRSILICGTGDKEYFSNELITNILDNITNDKTTMFEKILIGHFNNGYTTVDDIDIDSMKSYKMRYDYNTFTMFPIAIYCISRIIHRMMSEVDRTTE